MMTYPENGGIIARAWGLFAAPRKPKKRTLPEEVKDWAVSFVVAAVIYFILMPAAFGSSSPAVVVSSCSEKGVLNIGDIIFVAGTRIEDLNAPVIAVSGPSTIRPVVESREGRPLYVDKLAVGNETVAFDVENDIVVYNSNPYGYQIIHHAFVALNASGKLYLVTKGSANDIPDQFGDRGEFCLDENPGICRISSAVTQEMLIGKKVLPHVPLLGHVKLFFCDLTFNVLCEGHANAGTDYRYTLTC